MFIYMSNMLQLIPIALIIAGLVFLVTLASRTFIPEWNEERTNEMKGRKARSTVLTLMGYIASCVRTICFGYLLTIINRWD
jgi:hypothetical protein